MPQRRSGNVLPPPLDEYSNNCSGSTGKPIVKSAPNDSGSTGKPIVKSAPIVSYSMLSLSVLLFHGEGGGT